MSTLQKHIELTFSCDQDWSLMKPVACGKHCGVCKKDVFDFTNHSVGQIEKALVENETLCGRFTALQTDPDLIAELSIPFSNRVFAYLSTLLLFFSSARLSAQKQVTPTEQIASINESVPRFENLSETRTEHVCSETCSCNELARAERQRKYKRKRVYLSRRFPFVVVRRMRRMGGGRSRFHRKISLRKNKEEVMPKF